MYLFIDAGNTRIKYAGHDGGHGDWLFHDAVPSDGSVALALPPDFKPRAILAVSVASAATNVRIAEQLSSYGVGVEWFSSAPEAAGLRNAYEDPYQLGADRWAAAIGAWHRLHTACLVIGAGTATTIDVINADGVFEGGCILPGLDMMRRSLVNGTAALPWAAGNFETMPRNTADAMFAGCLNAQLGAIERVRATLPPAAPVILAGGAGEALAAHLAGRVERVPLLVLEGLRRYLLG